jgi:RNA polymerase sigma factor (sigma-70 family)
MEIKEITNNINNLLTKVKECRFIPDEDKKDISQDTILKLLTAKNFDITNSFEENKGYIFITTRNCCLAYHKTKKKDYNVVNADWIFETISNEGDKYYDNTNEYYMNKVNEILETDKAFNETEKLILKLRLMGLTNIQVSKQLGIKETSQIYYNARIKLKYKLNPKVRFIVRDKRLNKDYEIKERTDVLKFLPHLNENYINVFLRNELGILNSRYKVSKII